MPRLLHATFHPEMEGGDEYAGRIVALLRRSPDPFVQVIPHGTQQGGTTVFGTAAAAAADLETTYRRLRGPLLDELVASRAALHRERRHRYARYVDLFCPFAWYGAARADRSSEEASW